VRISAQPLWGFSSSNPYHSQSRAEHFLNFMPQIEIMKFCQHHWFLVVKV
jgi:hypothetical protein